MNFLIAFALLFSLTASAQVAGGMSHQDAFNIVHGLLGQVPLKAADSAQVEKALGMIKVLVAKRSAEDAEKVRKLKDDIIIKKYLEGLKEKKDG